MTGLIITGVVILFFVVIPVFLLVGIFNKLVALKNRFKNAFSQIEVQLKINTRSQFEYMHLKDLKAAGFEAEKLLSGWKYDPLWYYEEPRHSITNFFVSWLPHGEYIVRYRLRPTKPGSYRVSAATLQSMYAPEMTAHSAGFMVRVK